MNQPVSLVSQAFQQPRQEITRLLDYQLAPLGDLARSVIALHRDGALDDARLRTLTPRLTEALDRSDLYLGAGYAAAKGIVAGHELYLLWMQRTASGSASRLILNLDLHDADVYDYTDMEWYAHACSTLGPSVYGPYLDYTGADHYVLTACVPIVDETDLLGVAGADLLADELENRLAEVLHELSYDAMVVNTDRTVLASNTTRWISGERLATHPTRDRSSYDAVGTLSDWTSWVLVAGRTD